MHTGVAAAAECQWLAHLALRCQWGLRSDNAHWHWHPSVVRALPGSAGVARAQAARKLSPFSTKIFIFFGPNFFPICCQLVQDSELYQEIKSCTPL